MPSWAWLQVHAALTQFYPYSRPQHRALLRQLLPKAPPLILDRAQCQQPRLSLLPLLQRLKPNLLLLFPRRQLTQLHQRPLQRT